MARTHHEVIELGGSGHELRPTHCHTDLHEACVLAGLGLPHLTHDPAGKRGQIPAVTAGSQDSQMLPLGPTPPWPLLCSRVSGMAGEAEGKDILILPCKAPLWFLGNEEMQPTGVSMERPCQGRSPGEDPCVLTPDTQSLIQESSSQL